VWLLAGVFNAPAQDWIVHQIEGRDYLSMRNVAEFYSLGNVTETDKEVLATSSVRSLRATKNSNEFFINNLKFILSYPAVAHEGQIWISRMDLVKLIEPVMRPSKIKNAELVETIVLDAGHGGHDRGAVSAYGPEKSFALDTVLRAKRLLQAAGYNVVLTRDGDYFVPLHERTRIANRYKRALFISVHFNHGGAGTGVEAYTLAPRGVPSMMADGPRVSDLVACPGNARDAENMALATASHAALVVKTRMPDRGLKRARFVVIRDITIPGVLLEGGFQSNAYDSKMIATPLYRQTLAHAILTAVENYQRAVGAQPNVSQTPPPRVNLEPVPTPKPSQPSTSQPSKPQPSKPEPIEPPRASAGPDQEKAEKSVAGEGVGTGSEPVEKPQVEPEPDP
jgi:N-acetylmuramoyl-L-alanine amidase